MRRVQFSTVQESREYCRKGQVRLGCVLELLKEQILPNLVPSQKLFRRRTGVRQEKVTQQGDEAVKDALSFSL